MVQPLLHSLEQRALKRILEVRDAPDERYELRRAFYERYGFATEGTAGYGNSELAFLNWEIERGVLNRLDHPRQAGSRWWRAVNEKLLVDAELAALMYEAGHPPVGVRREVRWWMDYLATPSPASWYRAHNASVVRGYLLHAREAFLETETEQHFLTLVLNRLLFAQTLVLPGTLKQTSGGALLADPTGPFINILMRVEPLYPDRYPAPPPGLGRAARGGLLELMDERLIRPHLSAIYTTAAAVLELPDLPLMTGWGASPYPQFAATGPGAPLHVMSHTGQAPPHATRPPQPMLPAVQRRAL
jgi:hypothetical protein